MSYVLILSLGPVQRFIAAARKTSDLWLGSALLAELAAAAAGSLIRDDGAALIFPVPEDGGVIGDRAPNKIVALVKDDPAGAARRAADAANARLVVYRDQAYEVATTCRIDHAIDWVLLDDQLKMFLESFAAWYPCDDPENPEEYARAREGAERLLAGRKALRDFAPASGRDGVPKSSLDGERESVIRDVAVDARALLRAGLKPVEPLGGTKAPTQPGRVKVGEQLDGVSLIKRLAWRSGDVNPDSMPRRLDGGSPIGQQVRARRFVSLDRVAVDPLFRQKHDPRIARLRELAEPLATRGSGVVQRLPATMTQYQSFLYDGDLFYRDGSGVPGLDEMERTFAAQFYQGVRALVPQGCGSEPPAYLAVLAADGDHVGNAIERLAGTGADAHRAFSRATAGFARQAEELVTARHGALVYSGGDDVLAFVPLDAAMACAGGLHAAFDDAMRIAIPAAASRPTLSVGLAIGHYLEPMDVLLSWARAAERRAKDAGRNALAVSLHTRAGGNDEAVWCGSWNDEPVDRWQRWIEWFCEKRVPGSAVHDLDGLARELRHLAETGESGAAGLVEPETRRILQRKRGEYGARELSREDLDLILRDLGTGMHGAADAAVTGLESLVSMMLIARRIAPVWAMIRTPTEVHP